MYNFKENTPEVIERSMTNSDVKMNYLMESYFCSFNFLRSSPGPRLNIKTVLSTNGDFHVKDKTAVRTSYL